jgi:outer membrane biosynthesis protein TonB
VQLPKPQPLDEAALQTVTPPPAEPAAPAPKTPPKPKPAQVVGPQQKPEPAAPPPPEAERPRISEIVAPTEVKRLQDQAHGRLREVTGILIEVNKGRPLTQAQRNVVNSINSFVNASSDAEKRNDMRQADALAERAQVLARGLMNGK